MYRFPFGQVLSPCVEEDRRKKEVFVLGVYSSAVHARWIMGGRVMCRALAVASEPRIFWDGNVDEAKAIIDKIKIPKELGYLEPAGQELNGPSAKVLDKHILAPLGYTRREAWLCDLLPEARLNSSQQKVIRERYQPFIEKYSLNEVTVPKRPSYFCDEKRAEQITDELMASEAGLLVLLGDIPIAEYLKRVAKVNFSTLGEYCDLYGYGKITEVTIKDKTIKLLPLAHPRQIGALGAHSQKWFELHKSWEENNI